MGPLREELRELGSIEGNNVQIEARSARRFFACWIGGRARARL